MKITIEVDSKNELEKLSALLKTFKISTVKVVSADHALTPFIKGDKEIDPKDLFGIWSKKPRTIERIREDAWQRKLHIG